MVNKQCNAPSGRDSAKKCTIHKEETLKKTSLFGNISMDNIAVWTPEAMDERAFKFTMKLLSTCSSPGYKRFSPEDNQDLLKILKCLATGSKWEYVDLCNELLDKRHTNKLNKHIASSIFAARPYMTQTQQETCDEIVSSKLSHPLSLGDAVAILSLIISILCFLISLLPDKQLDAIIEQQTQILDVERQNSEYLEDILDAQQNENAALLAAVNSLTHTIEQLNSEIEFLKEQLPEEASSPASPTFSP